MIWSRGGAGPELSAVTFDFNTDGGNIWTALGNGTRVGTTSNWRLTALSLPANGYLRARGRTTNGYLDGGSGLIEQVTAFTAPIPLTLNIASLGTAVYNAGNDTTSITLTFVSLPNRALNMEYSTNLAAWTFYANNPANSGPTGSFNATFTAPGNQTALWNSKMFFKASPP